MPRIDGVNYAPEYNDIKRKDLPPGQTVAMHAPFIEITSRQNKNIQQTCLLHDRKARAAEKACIVEGMKILSELSPASNPIRMLFVSKDRQKAIPDSLTPLLSAAGQIFVVDSHLMEAISGTETPEGFLAVAEVKDSSAEAPDISSMSFILILDSIKDPGNLGTIFRTSYAAGVSSLILFGGSVDAYNAKTIRASAGTVFKLPFFSVSEDRISIVQDLKVMGLRIAASVMQGGERYWGFDYRPPLAFVLGNESHGISEKLLSICDCKVTIPMENPIESLNISTSAALLCYKFLEKKNCAKW